MFAYNIISSINDSNSLCPWKGWVHVYWTWTWTAKSFISKSSILCSWSLPRLSFLFPENGSRVSTYVCLGVDFDKGEFHGYLKGLDLLGDWKASCKSSLRKWETRVFDCRKVNSWNSLFLFFHLWQQYEKIVKENWISVKLKKVTIRKESVFLLLKKGKHFPSVHFLIHSWRTFSSKSHNLFFFKINWKLSRNKSIFLDQLISGNFFLFISFMFLSYSA